MRRLWNEVVATVAFGMLTNACCISMRRASEINAELRLQNIARAEPIMRGVALEQGAKLLPDQPRELGLVPWCSELGTAAPRRDCVLVPDEVVNTVAGRGNTYRLLDHAGHPRIAIAIGQASSTARLARRGTTFFVLIPQVTYRKIKQQTACDCNGGPVITAMSGYVNLGLSFVVDDLPELEVQQFTVPIVEDYIEWQCNRVWV